MKRFLFSLSNCALVICSSLAASSSPATDNAGIVIRPSEGEISPGDEIVITFPTAMVATDKIDVADQQCPFTSKPAIEGTFLWKSQTEGVFKVRAVVASAHHEISLVPGLTDAETKPIKAPAWRATLDAPEFTITTDYDERDRLTVRPQIWLSSSYAIKLNEAADHVYFQDRDSGQRFPVEVVIAEDQSVNDTFEAKDFRVAPRDSLPVGRTYDVIVNGLLDAKSRQPLPYLKVFRVGKTVPLSVDWVGAFNHPLEEPAVIMKFNDIIDPAEATSGNIRIEPAVKDMKLLAESDEIHITGAFDLKQRYQVTISTDLRGARGFGLMNESRWGATFRDKLPTIVFPASQVFLRAGSELRFSFFQINTPAVTWKLAAIPLEKLPAVTSRVREFERDTIDPVTGKPVKDPRTGFNKPLPTELLVDAFRLPVVATGSTDATRGNENTRRDIKCAVPQDKARSGALLFEAAAQLPDGRVVGNRSIICTSDLILAQKRTPDSVMLHVAKMSTAQPVAGITVRALTKENIELARAVTDKNGFATFERATVLPPKKDHAYLFVAESTGSASLQFVDGAFYYGSGEPDYSPAKQESHAEIITDRNLYRPGQVVKMKGMVRRYRDREPVIPDATEVHWTIKRSDEIAGEGTTALSRSGGWEAEWTIPETSELGELEIQCAIGNETIHGSTNIQVEEYRVPLFFVTVDAKDELGDTGHAQVRSVYFHGAPNTGARVHWRATWSAFAEFGNEEDGYKKRYNGFSEVGPRIDPNESLIKTIEGDSVLDDRGTATLSCESPFKDNAAVARAHVSWSVEVTSIDGQTLPGGQTTTVFAVPTRLGIKIAEQPGDKPAVNVQLDAVDQKNAKVGDIPVRVDLFHVTTKTAKEQIAPFVYRYRNTDQFEKVASREVKTPNDVDFPVTATGRYVAAAIVTDRKSVLVSDETTVTGEQPAELPVANETSFKIEHEARQFTSGEKARLTIQAPFGGVAWVSVETDRILDTLLVPLAGNAGRIDLPIRKEYAPNATVSIYLTKPGGDRDLPRERFATSTIEVRRPERELKIESRLAATTVKPGETVRGTVVVSSETKPVKDADLTVFATDDAVLTLGNWKLPDLISEFFPRNPFSVRSYQSLDRFIEQITQKSLTQKGFVLGGGEESSAAYSRQPARKEFKTLAFWHGSLTTDSDGKAAFEFTAPDNLTTYRIVALAQAKADQFGGDASTTLTTSKPLLINPALPRFLRDKDELELRASVQQNFADSEQVTMRCVTDLNCKLTAETELTREVKRDTPTVFRFKAKVQDIELSPARIRFEAVAKSNSKMADSVELVLPVEPPTIVRKESVAASFSGPRLDAQTVMPNGWKGGHGKFDTTISTSPWLPKLAGIPTVLEYPHGCFEQISTKLLGYSMLANLLAYLPNVEARDAEYRRVLERGMKQINDSLLETGMLPYWPGGETANPFVTCEAFWAVNESANAGFTVPEKLRNKLSEALKTIAAGRTGASVFDKCFALFVLSQYETGQDLGSTAQDLYLRRNETNDEGRALLAIAVHRLKVMAREKEQLLKEIAAPVKERAFDPSSFSSTTRAEAIIALAYDTVAPKMWNAERKKRVRDRMLALMDSSASLSTQENLWLLLAFKSMVDSENAASLTAMQPAAKLSKNGCSAAWLDQKLDQNLSISGLNQATLTFLLSARYTTDELDTQRVDRGFRIERVVRNMSDRKRTGEANAPFKIGDQILVTYRINTGRQHSYVALEDALPGGVEVLNPNLALIGRFLQMPPADPDDRVLSLSHSEMRDRATLLYFDEFAPGSGTYWVLARATAAGTFRWPATQIYPMYDSRFSGLSPSSTCVISGE